MALNAPLFLILLYLLPLLALVINLRYFVAVGMGKACICRSIVGWLVLSLLLVGAGLALLGAAYLHDVWYC